jgi:hypothetical protein
LLLVGTDKGGKKMTEKHLSGRVYFDGKFTKIEDAKILTPVDIQAQIKYRLDPRYRCSTCGGSGNVVTQYFDLSHGSKMIREGCPDCLGQGYNIRPEEKDDID